MQHVICSVAEHNHNAPIYRSQVSLIVECSMLSGFSPEKVEGAGAGERAEGGFNNLHLFKEEHLILMHK